MGASHLTVSMYRYKQSAEKNQQELLHKINDKLTHSKLNRRALLLQHR